MAENSRFMNIELLSCACISDKAGISQTLSYVHELYRDIIHTAIISRGLNIFTQFYKEHSLNKIS